MIIEEIETSPFTVTNSCIRQQKARDGESVGGWRLDLVAKNTDKKPRSKIEVSLRYYSEGKEFIGLDTNSLWKEETIKPNEVKDLTFYIEPPKDTSTVELRINSVVGLPTWIKEPPSWLIFVSILLISAAVVAINGLLN